MNYFKTVMWQKKNSFYLFKLNQELVTVGLLQDSELSYINSYILSVTNKCQDVIYSNTLLSYKSWTESKCKILFGKRVGQIRFWQAHPQAHKAFDTIIEDHHTVLASRSTH